jgi:hypothetical protein
MALVAEDIKNATKLSGTDIIIAYGLSQIYQYYVADGLQGDGSHRIWKEQCTRYFIHCF